MAVTRKRHGERSELSLVPQAARPSKRFAAFARCPSFSKHLEQIAEVNICFFRRWEKGEKCCNYK
jgi:hypothetical protein